MRKINFNELFEKLLGWVYLLFIVGGIVYSIWWFIIKPSHFIPISEILNDPIKYQGKEVAVRGTIIDAKYKESDLGPEYAVYVLSDGTGVIKVFVDCDVDPESDICNWEVGAKVKVLGKYYWVRYVGPYVFFNQINAESISLDRKEWKKVQELLEKEEKL
jgi:hypothetical protein